jgi:CRP-like cAMP-binding protein
MQRLRGCPHVVQVVDAYADEKYRYVVMELCYGLDLVDAIFEELATAAGEDEPVINPHDHIPHIAAVFREMVTAVGECHQNKVYHMDIKPENFIHVSTESIDGAPSVKLLDVDSTRISHGTQLGCSKYLAPELFKTGIDVVPEAVDMYALGVSLFNLFTGRFPYPFYRMGKPRARPDLSQIAHPEARNLVEQLLSADPTQRGDTSTVLDHPFLKIHSEAKVTPLSDLTTKSVKSFFLEESPSALMGRGCACAEAKTCPHRARARTLKEGEVLFSEGDYSRAVYFVSNGSFNIIKNGNVVGSCENSSVIGEMGALFNRPRYATVIAAEDSEIYEFKDFGEKLGSTQQRYALKGLQEIALKRHLVDTTRDTLKNTPLFREASNELLNTIAAGSDRAYFNQGDMVLEEDVEKMALYIVQDGILEVRRNDSSMVSYVGPGEIVGEPALLFGQRYSGETLKALKPTTAVVLDRSEFALILSEFPKEREVIMKSAEWRWKEMGVTASV